MGLPWQVRPEQEAQQALPWVPCQRKGQQVPAEQQQQQQPQGQELRRREEPGGREPGRQEPGVQARKRQAQEGQGGQARRLRRREEGALLVLQCSREKWVRQGDWQ